MPSAADRTIAVDFMNRIGYLDALAAEALAARIATARAEGHQAGIAAGVELAARYLEIATVDRYDDGGGPGRLAKAVRESALRSADVLSKYPIAEPETGEKT